VQNRIKALDTLLCNQIAAGEVVERPGSALKELCENSLDAGATQIRVELKGGGADLLVVNDNGHGIHNQDLLLALSRHATSKIRTADDLFAIRSWGFRGEALAAINAVSRLKISSRRSEASEGREIISEAGTITSDRPVARSIGTSISVEDLFFNTPVRKKFLKSLAGESSHCIQTIHRLALASPEVDWELWIDDQKQLHYPSVKDPRDRIVQVFRDGLRTKVTADELIKLDETRGNLRVWGYLLPSAALIPSTRGIFTYVNQRSVKDKLLQQAITTAAREVLFGASYPQIVLHIDTDPENVDVNVHPTKAEVRFRNGSQLFGLIRSTLEKALAAQRPLTAAPLPAPAAFGSTNLDLGLAMPAQYAQKLAALPEMQKVDFTTASHLSLTELTKQSGPQFLCTLKNTYLVCQDEEGLLLVDQHAAHERVTYERLKANEFAKSVAPSAALLIPLMLEVPTGAGDLLEQASPQLSALGLDFDRAGPSQITVRALPPLLITRDGNPRISLGQLFRSIADELEHSTPEASAEILKSCILETLASQSCHGSVRAGQTLSAQEVSALLRDMTETDFAGHCPHGRPTTVRLKWSDIERMFKRIH
jgi:DNA mismatch repair protein MutL